MIMVSLPEEIEYEIFRLATSDAQRSEIGLLNLTLVAHRVNNWVRSFVFRFVIVAPFRPYKKTLKALQTLPPSFLQQNTTSVCILFRASESDTQLALERCSNTESLAYWNSLPATSPLQIRSLIQNLPLHRLAIEVNLFAELCKEADISRFRYSLHELALTVIPEEENDSDVPNFSAFPNLTRFIVSTVACGTFVPKLVNAILATVRCEVVVFYGDCSADVIDKTSFAMDCRFIFYPNSDGHFIDWKRLEESSQWKSFWAQAEKRIAALQQ